MSTSPKAAGNVSFPWLDAAAADAQAYAEAAKIAVKAKVIANGKLDRKAADVEQHIVHGLGWVATYAETLKQVAAWAEALQTHGTFGETEQLLAKLLVAEYAAQLAGGVPMTQVEIIRPADFGVAAPPVSVSITQEEKSRLAVLLREGQGRATLENTNLDDDMEMIRDQFHKFADAEVAPFAHQWHMRDELIPIEIIQHMGELGVFGLTIPEEFGGSGLGKTAMCVVSEELSRGYIGVGSLGHAFGNRGGADPDRRHGRAESRIVCRRSPARNCCRPPCLQSRTPARILGSLRTRAVKDGDHYIVTGNKTWITHAARADVMTLLVRTDPETKDHRGLSMLIAPKQRGDVDHPFPTEGMSGGEIEVLGYRGMKEYEIGFDGFEVQAANLLGGVEGQGFKQLMATFESARVQTAARAIGVAQCAHGAGAEICAGAEAIRQRAFRLPARLQQIGDDGGGIDGGAAAHLFRGAPEGQRQTLRS